MENDNSTEIKNSVIRAYNMFDQMPVFEVKVKGQENKIPCVSIDVLRKMLTNMLIQENPMFVRVTDVPDDISLRESIANTSDIILKDFIKSLSIGLMLKGLIKMDPTVADILGINMEEPVPQPDLVSVPQPDPVPVPQPVIPKINSVEQLKKELHQSDLPQPIPENRMGEFEEDDDEVIPI